MANQTESKAGVQAKQQGRQPAETTSQAPGFTAKAGDMVQTILGTMAGVVEGIGILVTGSEAEKRAKAAAAKKALQPVKTARKAPAAKKAAAKKSSVKKTAPKKAAAKKAVSTKAVKQAAPKKAAPKQGED